MVSQRLPYQVQTADKFPPTTNKKPHSAQILSGRFLIDRRYTIIRATGIRRTIE